MMRLERYFWPLLAAYALVHAVVLVYYSRGG